MSDTDPPLQHRRLLCCVLAIELAGHEERPVFDQIRATHDLRQLLADAASTVPRHELVAIGREDGVLLVFAADPAACFETAFAVRAASLEERPDRNLQVRIGIDLGPAELIEEAAGQAWLGGDARRDAERLVRHIAPGQLAVTRAFFEVLTRLAPAHCARLEYQGLLSDTVARPLGWYVLDAAAREQPAVTQQTRHGIPRTRAAAVPAGRRRRKLGLPLRLAGAGVLALGLALAGRSLQVSPTVPDATLVAEPALEVALAPTARDEEARVDTDSRDPPADPPGDGPMPDAAAAIARPASAHSRAIVPAVAPLGMQPARPLVAVPKTRVVTVHLAVRPWGEVLVDGRSMGVSPPLKTLRLAPGTHVVTLRNGTLPPLHRQLVLPAGSAAVSLVHDFGCAAVRGPRCPDVPGTSSGSPPPLDRGARRNTMGVDVIGRAGRPELAGSPAPPAIAVR